METLIMLFILLLPIFIIMAIICAIVVIVIYVCNKPKKQQQNANPPQNIPPNNPQNSSQNIPQNIPQTSPQNKPQNEYFMQTNKSYSDVVFDKGRRGEYLIYDILKNMPGYKHFLFNTYIPKANGETTEIDVILIHQSGIYIFESKNYSGWIFGNENQQYWTQSLRGRHGTSTKNKFFNPIMQNEVHIKWFTKFLNIDRSLLYSYIVFGDCCELKNVTLNSSNHRVINMDDIFNAVMFDVNICPYRFTPQQIDEIYQKMLPLTNVTEEQKNQHIQNIQQRYNSNVNNIPPVVDEFTCPQCGGRLVEKIASSGERQGKKCLECSNYPKCGYIKNID